MSTSSDLLHLLRMSRRLPASDVLARLDVSRATLMRAVKALGPSVVVRGSARRTAYAARRPIRGNLASIPIYRIDAAGRGSVAGQLDPLYPEGYAVRFEGEGSFEWPLALNMIDGWFEGLPYFLEDMRPQGFLGRNFARQISQQLQVPENPVNWPEDDIVFVLSTLGADLPGNYIVGELAYRRFLEQVRHGVSFLTDAEVGAAYPRYAREAMENGIADSSAGGEFPKFTARRMLENRPQNVLVKFSGNDDSPGVQRWSDLLICEHLAMDAVARQLQMDASSSRLYRADGRTFLEVLRFDRHGEFGRSGVCSWAALNAALFGFGGISWASAAKRLREQGTITIETERDMQRIWHFGQLIANTDMHDGNLAFRPGMTLAPVFDMLPMHYAPVRGIELVVRKFAPNLPLPQEREVWLEAADAALCFWGAAATDVRISAAFRHVCTVNANEVRRLMGRA